MKIDLTISDATFSELSAIAAALSGLNKPPAAASDDCDIPQPLVYETPPPPAVVEDEAIEGELLTDADEPHSPTATIIDHTEELFKNAPREIKEVDVDSAGVAWSAYHHSANRSVNADGTWRKRPVRQSETTIPPLPPTPPGEPTKRTAPVIMMAVSNAVKLGLMTQVDVDAALATVGAAKMVDLVKQPAALEQFAQILGV